MTNKKQYLSVIFIFVSSLSINCMNKLKRTSTNFRLICHKISVKLHYNNEIYDCDSFFLQNNNKKLTVAEIYSKCSADFSNGNFSKNLSDKIFHLTHEIFNHQLQSNNLKNVIEVICINYDETNSQEMEGTYSIDGKQAIFAHVKYTDAFINKQREIPLKHPGENDDQKAKKLTISQSIFKKKKLLVKSNNIVKSNNKKNSEQFENKKENNKEHITIENNKNVVDNTEDKEENEEENDKTTKNTPKNNQSKMTRKYRNIERSNVCGKGCCR